MRLEDNAKLYKEDVFVRIGMNGPIINTIPECYHLLPRQQIFESISSFVLNAEIINTFSNYTIDNIAQDKYNSMFAWKLICYINGVISLDSLNNSKELLIPPRNYVLRLMASIEDDIREPTTQVVDPDLRSLGEPRFFTVLGKTYDVRWAENFIKENYVPIT